MVDGFGAVRGKPIEALRRLLEGGDASERVWAAWALGLALGGDFAAELGLTVGQEPDAGTRRHLIVILSAFGERAALTALAATDPDAHVRATACQYLARLAAADPELWHAVARGLDDQATIVRETIVRQLPAGAPDTVRAAVLRQLKHPAPEVRRAVVEQLDVIVSPGRPLPEVVMSQAVAEPEPDIRRRLLERWSHYQGPASLVGGVAATGRDDLAIDALEVLAKGGAQFAWADLAPLTRSAGPELERVLFELFVRRPAEMPLDWLIRYLEGENYYLLWSGGLAEHVLDRLRSSGATDLSADARRSLTTLGEALRKDLDGAHEEERWPEDETAEDMAYEQARELQVAALIDEAKRLSS